MSGLQGPLFSFVRLILSVQQEIYNVVMFDPVV